MKYTGPSLNGKGTDLAIEELVLAAERIEVSEAAIDEIAAVGYDPSYGARPVKRVIQREIQNRLATALLKQDYEEGTTIYVDYNGSEFTFRDQPAELVR